VEGGTKPAPQGLRQRHHGLLGLVGGTRARTRVDKVFFSGLCAHGLELENRFKKRIQ
jgi:hypothetical protein